MKQNIVILLCLSSLSLFSQNDTWHHIRGAGYNAHANADGLHIERNQKFPVLWKTKTGQGYSGSIIADNKLYTQAQNRGGQYIICLDTTSGKELWRTRYGWPWEVRGQYPGTYATPTWYKGKIYFCGCFGEIGCMDGETGKIVWQKSLEKDFKIKIPSFGYACTPLLYDGKMYLTLGEENGSTAALNASNGKLIWKTGKEPASYSSPILVKVGTHIQIVCFLANYIAGYDPETGKELWKEKISDGYDEHAAWPVYDAPYLFCASPFFRSAFLMKLGYNGNEPTLQKIWHNKTMSNDIFSSVITKTKATPCR